MNHEDIPFEKFFTDRLKQKGMSIKKLAETTGIARSHIENIASGNFKDMPSAPYFRGYLIRLGKILDFDGDERWEEIKKEGMLKKSGPKDMLPKNRFIKKHPSKFIWAGAVFVIAIVYIIFRFARIAGMPTLTLIFPAENPATVSSSEITLQGTVTNADSLSIGGETVPIAQDGTWQKNVLLFPQNPNTFQITAKKFLGGETDIVEQIFYEPATGTFSTGTTSTSINSSGTIQGIR